MDAEHVQYGLLDDRGGVLVPGPGGDLGSVDFQGSRIR